MSPSDTAPTLNIAIILAGGNGHRAAQHAALDTVCGVSRRYEAAEVTQISQIAEQFQEPKQFWKLGGQALWRHSWLRYACHPRIDMVCLVCPEAYVVQIREELASWQAPPGPSRPAPCFVIAGGAERHESSSRALEFSQQWQFQRASQAAAPVRRVQVLIHDAARPLVSERIIDESLRQLRHSDAVVCAVPAQDSLFVADAGHSHVSRLLDRASVMLSQTPQSFELQTLRRAFTRHQLRNEIAITDDISLVKHYLPETGIRIVPGESANMKLTRASDLQLLEYLLGTRAQEKVLKGTP